MFDTWEILQKIHKKKMLGAQVLPKSHNSGFILYFVPSAKNSVQYIPDSPRLQISVEGVNGLPTMGPSTTLEVDMFTLFLPHFLFKEYCLCPGMTLDSQKETSSWIVSHSSFHTLVHAALSDWGAKGKGTSLRMPLPWAYIWRCQHPGHMFMYKTSILAFGCMILEENLVANELLGISILTIRKDGCKMTGSHKAPGLIHKVFPMHWWVCAHTDMDTHTHHSEPFSKKLSTVKTHGPPCGTGSHGGNWAGRSGCAMCGCDFMGLVSHMCLTLLTKVMMEPAVNTCSSLHL